MSFSRSPLTAIGSASLLPSWRRALPAEPSAAQSSSVRTLLASNCSARGFARKVYANFGECCLIKCFLLCLLRRRALISSIQELRNEFEFQEESRDENN